MNLKIKLAVAAVVLAMTATPALTNSGNGNTPNTNTNPNPNANSNSGSNNSGGNSSTNNPGNNTGTNTGTVSGILTGTTNGTNTGTVNGTNTNSNTTASHNNSKTTANNNSKTNSKSNSSSDNNSSTSSSSGSNSSVGSVTGVSGDVMGSGAVVINNGLSAEEAKELSGTSDNSVNFTDNSRYEAQKRNPVSTTWAAPLVASDDTCMGSTSVGGQGITIGLSIGTTWSDKDCVIRKDSRLLHNANRSEIALSLMCSKKAVREAVKRAGTDAEKAACGIEEEDE